MRGENGQILRHAGKEGRPEPRRTQRAHRKPPSSSLWRKRIRPVCPPPELRIGFPPLRAASLPLSSRGDLLRRVRPSTQRHINRRFRQFLTKAALIELGDQGTL